MRKARSRQGREEMLPEYDFSTGVRGKYASRFAKDTIMVVLDPDVAEVFPDPKSVNKALRALGPSFATAVGGLAGGVPLAEV